MLRILTLNTQFRSTTMEALGDKGNTSDAPERAKVLVSVITTNKPFYDVLCLNEVFDETARGVLLNGLKPDYPHVIEKMPAEFAVTQVGEEDSGLMVFSKQPINSSKELVYGGGAAEDALALKGALAVRLQGIVIIATHLQAKDGAKFEKVRTAQIGELSKLAKGEIDAVGNFVPVAVMGDFNINGDQMLRFGDAGQQAKLKEWTGAFDASTVTGNSPLFASTLKDAWCFEFLPANPAQLPADGTDPGLTASNKRYDFVLTSRAQSLPTAQTFPLTLHRMRIAYELFAGATAGGKSSDHLGIVTSFQTDNGAITPRKAGTLSPDASLSPAHSDNSGPLTSVDGECLLDGAQWLRVDEPGSYGFFLMTGEKSARFHPFTRSDFSRPMPNYKRESLELELRQGTFKFQKYIIPTAPFYILVDSNRRDRTFKYRFLAYRFIGTNPTEALVLVDHAAPQQISFKVKAPHSLPIPGVPIDTTDGVWFRIDPIKLTMPKLYKAKVRLEGKVPGGVTVALLRDGDPMKLVEQRPKGPLPIDFVFETKGGERLFLVVQRNDPSFKAADLRASYRSPVSLWHGSRQGIPGGGVLQIQCTDETNPEFFESDDIRLEVAVDGKHFRTITNNEIGDFDDDDVKPLEPFFKNPIAFMNTVVVKVIDEDPGQDESGDIVFAALPEGTVSAFNIEVATQFADGEYFIHANLSRFDPR